jgi:hypothetical protein
MTELKKLRELAIRSLEREFLLPVHPQTILKLLDEVEALEQKFEDATSIIDKANLNPEYMEMVVKQSRLAVEYVKGLEKEVEAARAMRAAQITDTATSEYWESQDHYDQIRKQNEGNGEIYKGTHHTECHYNSCNGECWEKYK